MKKNETTDLERFISSRINNTGRNIDQIASRLEFKSIGAFRKAIKDCYEQLDIRLIRSLSEELETPEAFLTALTLKKYNGYRTDEEELFDKLRRTILDFYPEFSKFLKEDKHRKKQNDLNSFIRTSHSFS